MLGQEHQAGAGGPDRLANGLAFVRAEIVEDHDIAGLQRRDEKLFDIGAKALAVDGAVEQAGRVDAVAAPGGEEGRGLPVAVRDRVDEALAARGPAVAAGPVGFGPSLVDEDEAGRIDAALIGSPACPMPADVRPVSFARDERLLWNGPPLLPAS